MNNLVHSVHTDASTQQVFSTAQMLHSKACVRMWSYFTMNMTAIIGCFGCFGSCLFILYKTRAMIDCNVRRKHPPPLLTRAMINCGLRRQVIKARRIARTCTPRTTGSTRHTRLHRPCSKQANAQLAFPCLVLQLHLSRWSSGHRLAPALPWGVVVRRCSV